MSSKSTGTEERISLTIPRVITDPLKSLFELQSLFDTSALNKGHNSWEYIIKNHNLLCITTNTEGLFTLVVKNGYIGFYEREHSFAVKIDLSGKDINTVLVKLCKAIERSLYCVVSITEHEVGSRREFKYRLISENGSIVREYLSVICYSDR